MIGELEDRPISEQNKGEKWMKNPGKIFRDMWEIRKQSHIMCNWSPENKDRNNGEKKVFEKIITKDFPLVKDINPYLRNPFNHK